MALTPSKNVRRAKKDDQITNYLLIIRKNILRNYVREKIEFSFCCLWKMMLQNCSPMKGKSRITAKM